MNSRTGWTGLVLLTALFIAVSLNCSPIGLGGNSTQTGNGMIAGLLYQPDGATPAAGASVFLRRKNTLFDVSGTLVKKSADTVMTDNNGRFMIDSIDTGAYIIEGTDGGNNFALIDPVFVKYFDSTLALPPDTLKPAGAIKGIIRLSEGGDQRKVFVLAFGLDRFAATETDGAFKFGRLAHGNYHLRIMSLLDDYGVFDTMNIPVTSADTTDIGVIELPFTGIPTIKNLTISYDTLHQRVTLRWSRPGTALVKSFNMHRRAIDPATAIFEQLNSFPVIDTFFIDSLCGQNMTYEYRVTAVDSNAHEGRKSNPAQVRIALYDITPKDFAILYDTLKQAITVQWSNPDTALVTGYNVYRRNVDLNEMFWTPSNNSPIAETSVVDSTFTICPRCPSYDFSSGDSMGALEPTYEYCVGAVIKNVREGIRTAGKSVRISFKHLTPADVMLTYDTLKQSVRLSWARPDTGLVKGFAVFRRNCDVSGELLSKLNRNPVSDTFYFDSTGGQNQTYEYRIASLVKNSRAEIKSTGVQVRIAASFVAADSMLAVIGSQAGELSKPNDIAVSTSGDMYLVDQGNGRIQVFDSTMRYKSQFGNGVLRHPLKVSVNDQGNAFVADYTAGSDDYSIFTFDASGTPIDSIHESTSISDLDIKDTLLYVLTAGRSVSIYSCDGGKKRSWQISGQDGCKGIVAGDSNKLFVSTGMSSPDINKVIVFDSLGRGISSFTFSDYPFAFAFDDGKQLLYAVCYNGTHGSMLHVVDGHNTEVANYKIQSDEQTISIGLRKDGAVLLVFRNEAKILKLKPLFQ